MRFLLNLSVGRKLAASASLAVLLLVALLALVWTDGGEIIRAQQHQASFEEARARTAAGMRALRDSATLERDLLLAQDAAGQAAARQALMARLDEGLAEVAAGAAGEPETAQAVPALRAAHAAYRDALAALADERASLIRIRDERLFGQSGDYDTVFEAVNASLAYDLQGDAQEDARQRIMTVHGAVNDLRFGAQRYLATGEEAQMRRVRRGIAQARVHGRGLASIEAVPRLKEDFARLGERAAALATAAEELLASGEAVAKLRAERVAPARAALEEQIASLTQIQARIGEARRDAVSKTIGEVRSVTLWAGGSVMLVVVLSGLLTARAVGSPLRRLAAAMGAIAGGDASVTVPDRGRRDEIGTIAEALETLRGTAAKAFAQGQMIEQMQTAVMSVDPQDDFRITYMNPASMELMAKLPGLPCKPEEMVGRSFDMFHKDPSHQRAIVGNPDRLPHVTTIRQGEEVLALRVSAIRDAAGGFAGAMLTWELVTARVRLADTFEREVGAVVEAVASSAERLQASARTLSATAATSGEEAAAVAQAGGQAHADVQSVAAAAEEMAASVTEIARRVGEAAEVAGRAVAEARATDTTVQGLSEAAARIGDVVKLIGDIAGQTNLLALNATIEAARAGEAGKGFAVVASEVKSLAGQTAKATEEIARQIADMQAATAQAVGAIRGIGATVERTSEIATTIAAAVEQQGAATQEIARSAAQVAEATSTVASRIESVRSAAEATGASAGAMRDDSGALAGQAATLREKAGSFLKAVRAM
jgi:methyl-accepting chemotaxis protein